MTRSEIAAFNARLDPEYKRVEQDILAVTDPVIRRRSKKAHLRFGIKFLGKSQLERLFA